MLGGFVRLESFLIPVGLHEVVLDDVEDRELDRRLDLGWFLIGRWRVLSL